MKYTAPRPLVWCLATLAGAAHPLLPRARAADPTPARVSTSVSTPVPTTAPTTSPTTLPTTRPAPAADTSRAWLLHLPGIAGETGIDRRMLQGLRDGGYDGPAEIYDWTGPNPGIPALVAHDRNRVEAKKIAEKIADHARHHPGGQILLTSHSAGTGLAAWALEELPDDVKVDGLLLLSSALSSTYDLTKALEHVRGKAYAFTNPGDVLVLGAGTRWIGTIDGKKEQAAGRTGFVRPDDADERQYEKLVPRPYDPDWMRYGNIGDHIGDMSRPFAADVLAPLLLAALPPAAAPAQPTTRPSVTDP